MRSKIITPKDKKLAANCVKCPVCKTARRKQKGFSFWFVKKIEHGICPSCQAYEKVYGRKAFEAEPTDVKQ